jgi:hypothetical protein
VRSLLNAPLGFEGRSDRVDGNFGTFFYEWETLPYDVNQRLLEILLGCAAMVAIARSLLILYLEMVSTRSDVDCGTEAVRDYAGSTPEAFFMRHRQIRYINHPIGNFSRHSSHTDSTHFLRSYSIRFTSLETGPLAILL